MNEFLYVDSKYLLSRFTSGSLILKYKKVNWESLSGTFNRFLVYSRVLVSIKMELAANIKVKIRLFMVLINIRWNKYFWLITTLNNCGKNCLWNQYECIDVCKYQLSYTYNVSEEAKMSDQPPPYPGNYNAPPGGDKGGPPPMTGMILINREGQLGQIQLTSVDIWNLGEMPCLFTTGSITGTNSSILHIIFVVYFIAVLQKLTVHQMKDDVSKIMSCVHQVKTWFIS